MANQLNESTQHDRANGKDKGPMSHTMGDAGDVMDKAKDTAQSLLSQAKNTAGEAYDKVADRTVSTIEESKAGVTSGLRSVADSVRKVGDNLNTGTEKTPVSEYSA